MLRGREAESTGRMERNTPGEAVSKLTLLVTTSKALVTTSKALVTRMVQRTMNNGTHLRESFEIEGIWQSERITPGCLAERNEIVHLNNTSPHVSLLCLCSVGISLTRSTDWTQIQASPCFTHEGQPGQTIIFIASHPLLCSERLFPIHASHKEACGAFWWDLSNLHDDYRTTTCSFCPVLSTVTKSWCAAGGSQHRTGAWCETAANLRATPNPIVEEALTKGWL